MPRDRWHSRTIQSVNDRDALQSTRGLACLLVVAYHVIGHTDSSGLKVAADSAYRLANDLLIHIRMPLFTVLSGFVYAYRPTMPAQGMLFLQNKTRRLLVPLFTATTVIYFGHYLEGLLTSTRGQGSLWAAYLFSYEHLWFIQALLLTLIVTVILEYLRALATPRAFLISMSLSIAWFLWHPFENVFFFSVDGMDYLLPFFLFGVGLNRYGESLITHNASTWFLCCFLAFQGTFTAVLFSDHSFAVDRHGIFAILIGFSAAYCAINFMPRIAALQAIGAFSFVIYLYHPILPAVVRLVASKIHLETLSLLFILGLATGLVGPIILGKIAKLSSIGKFFILGEKPPQAPKESTS